MAYLKNWTDNLFQIFFRGTSWVAVSINNIKTWASREMTSRKKKIVYFNGLNVAKHWHLAGRGICHLWLPCCKYNMDIYIYIYIYIHIYIPLNFNKSQRSRTQSKTPMCEIVYTWMYVLGLQIHNLGKEYSMIVSLINASRFEHTMLMTILKPNMPWSHRLWKLGGLSRLNEQKWLVNSSSIWHNNDSPAAHYQKCQADPIIDALGAIIYW